MNVFRNFFGVIAGYLFFAISALMLFRLSGTDPHAEATSSALALVILFGGVSAFIAGYFTKLIAATKTLLANYVLAVIMAGFAAFSYFASAGSHYTQIAAIFLFAPLSLAGGVFRRRSEV